MNIVGLDSLVFGVEDVAGCCKHLIDFGLAPTEMNAAGGRFTALDSSSLIVRRRDDPSLPNPLGTSCQLRETVYGVKSEADLDALEEELRKDREVTRNDGIVRARDECGFALAFQVTQRRPIIAPVEKVNAPGAEPQRKVNEIGVQPGVPVRPRTLSHVVYFVPDSLKAEAFYARLGFTCSDRFAGVGPFLRPSGARPSRAVSNPNAASDERCRAFCVPPRRTDGGLGCRHTLRRARSSLILGAGTPRVWQQLVLVLRKPARLSYRVRRRYGPAR